MGLEILREEHHVVAYVTATQRLWLTADRDRLVEDGDPAAAILFCTPGKRISLADAARYGLTAASEADDSAVEGSSDAEAPPKAEPEAKEADAPEDKEAVTEGDKGVSIPPRTPRASKRR